MSIILSIMFAMYIVQLVVILCILFDQFIKYIDGWLGKESWIFKSKKHVFNELIPFHWVTYITKRINTFWTEFK